MKYETLMDNHFQALEQLDKEISNRSAIHKIIPMLLTGSDCDKMSEAVLKLYLIALDDGDYFYNGVNITTQPYVK